MTVKEELEDLVGSPGWQRVLDEAEREYGTGGAVFRAYYAQTEGRSNVELGEHLRALLKAQEAVRRMVRWPVNELKRLEAQTR
jgi:hypothetical protein